MTQQDTCPRGCDLTGEQIPPRWRHMYREGATNYSRAIGEYDPLRDRTVRYTCPDCAESWEPHHT